MEEEKSNAAPKGDFHDTRLGPRANRMRTIFWTALAISTAFGGLAKGRSSYPGSSNKEVFICLALIFMVPTFLFGIVYKYFALFDPPARPDTDGEWT